MTGSTTDAEVDQRVDQVMDMLANLRMGRAKIVAWAQSPQCPWRNADGEPISASSVDRYIRKAKIALRKAAEPKRLEVLGVANRRYDTLYREAFSAKDYRAAADVVAKWTKLNGVDPAQKAELTGKDGGPVRIVTADDLTDDELAAIATGRGE